MLDLCQTFRHLATNTWDKLSQAKSTRMQIREQTFTDDNLLQLAVRHPNNVFVRTFTNREESQNGADWELWITHNNLWMGFRIQDKVINLRTDKYECLHYESKSKNHKGYQCDTLIKQALNSNLIPLYCLYTYWKWEDYQDAYFNYFYYRYPVRDIANYGCSLLSPFTVFFLQYMPEKINNHIKTLMPFILPWNELFCPHVAFKEQLIQVNMVENSIFIAKILFDKNHMIKLDILKNINEDKESFNKTFNTYFEKLINTTYYRDPPRYIQDILNGRDINDDDTNDERDVRHIAIVKYD